MQNKLLAFVVFVLFALIFVSCEKANELQNNNQAVEVTITFPDFIFTFEDQTFNAPASPKAPSITGMSPVSPSEAGMNRISLAVFGSDTTRRLNVEETKAKIASLEYIQNELNGIANLAK